MCADNKNINTYTVVEIRATKNMEGEIHRVEGVEH